MWLQFICQEQDPGNRLKCLLKYGSIFFVVMLIIGTILAIFLDVSPFTPDASNQKFGVNMSHSEKYDYFKYAKASYCKEETLKQWNCGVDCEHHSEMLNVKVFTDWRKTQAFTAYNPAKKEIVISFRGTSNLANWVWDISFVQVKLDGSICMDCKVHAGFQNAIQPYRDDITTYVRMLTKIHNTNRVVVTGHSLGGALAVLMAEYLASDNQFSYDDDDLQISLVTFAAPRVGDAAFVKHFNKILFNQMRIVSRHDIVPMSPPHSFGFQHTGNEVWYYDAKDPFKFTVCEVEDQSKENFNCLHSVLPTLMSTGDHTSLFGEYTGCAANSDPEKKKEDGDMSQRLSPLADQVKEAEIKEGREQQSN